MTSAVRHTVAAVAMAAVAFVAGVGSAALAAQVGVEIPVAAVEQWFQAR